MLLETRRQNRHLRWMMGEASVRAYTVAPSSEEQFCVSTRSAELTLVLEGEMWLEMGPQSQLIGLRPGQGCIVLRGTPHRIHASAAARFVVIDLVQPPGTDHGAIHIGSSAIPPVLERSLPGLWEQHRAPAAAQVAAWADRLRRGQLDVLRPGHSTAHMLQVKRHLERHHATPLQLQDVARSFSLNRFYLARNFKKNFGISPNGYLQFLRLEHFAWSLMQQGRSSLTDLSWEAGFGDYSTFSRRMRRAFGQPPSELVTLCR